MPISFLYYPPHITFAFDGNMLTKIGIKSTSVCDEIRRRIAKSTVVGADETGLYVNSALNWVWIFQTDQLTYEYQ